MFATVITVASCVAGAITAVVDCGSGSLLTPLLSWQVRTRLAVAARAMPHLMATVARFWTLRREVDRRVLSTVACSARPAGLPERCGMLWRPSPR